MNLALDKRPYIFVPKASASSSSSSMNYHKSLPLFFFLWAAVGASSLPSSIDWRNYNGRGYVTSPKNQDGILGVPNSGVLTAGHDNSWAFAAAAVAESAFLKSNRGHYNFAEQQILDCARDHSGCFDLTIEVGLDFITKQGISTESEYFYSGEHSCRWCRASRGSVNASEMKIYWSDDNTEDSFAETLVKYGPLGVTMCRDKGNQLDNYKGGVYNNPAWSTTCWEMISMQLVGYGTTEIGGLDYWILKNSWGTQWGERGFLRLAKGFNMCGITNRKAVFLA